MTIHTIEQLTSQRCKACEGNTKKISVEEATEQLKKLPGWNLMEEGRKIRKDWKAQDFLSGMKFLDQVGEIAEQEGHHPDLHLENYRQVWIAIGTHAIDGLSENDFILAAKIERLVSSAGLTTKEAMPT
jgi:4a-hydroxytetrahydrobiopterin dehydratase